MFIFWIPSQFNDKLSIVLSIPCHFSTSGNLELNLMQVFKASKQVQMYARCPFGHLVARFKKKKKNICNILSGFEKILLEESRKT